MNSSENTFETIHFNIFSLKDLNVLLYQDLLVLSKVSPDSFAIYFGFKHMETPTFRVLLEEEALTETTSETTAVLDNSIKVTPNTTNTNGTSIRIQPYVMTGYMFSLLALFVVLLGSIALCSVQAPDKFPRLPLNVGRESN